MLQSRLRLAIALILLLVPLLWWGFASTRLSDEPILDNSAARIDFFVREARITRWNPSGEMAQELNSPLMRHYPEPAEMLFDKPITLIPREQGGELRILAQEGRMPDSQERIVLAGDVQLHDNPPSGSASEMLTERLTLYPPRDYAHTDLPVRVIRGQDHTEGRGMEVFFDEQRVELLSEVKGTYHAN
ncbi:LPS export ABC transporter periplasmic protein LptC [Marinobacterium sp. MBR-109]|jgi:LPS export ABC transporter protein LptC|uniref:LPS export ABC transporter periplasmic protein LptC n=1 Tax=Marinobacterium sp. MBR-109 TaxID=3156462 RepID=UPI003397CEB4